MDVSNSSLSNCKGQEVILMTNRQQKTGCGVFLVILGIWTPGQLFWVSVVGVIGTWGG